jgi:hypothetical protein
VSTLAKRSDAANRVRKSRGESCYELSFVTPEHLVELLLEGPTQESEDALNALASLVEKTSSDLPPICLTCDHVFALDLPAAVMLVKPFASAPGKLITAGVCGGCLKQGRETLIAKALERFRASGMTDVRILKGGNA